MQILYKRVKTCYKIKINSRESKSCFYGILLSKQHQCLTIVPLLQSNSATIRGKRIRDAAFFLIIMLVTFAATLLKPQNYVSSR
ncbi:hypothetical protein, partial [Prevotella sp.]|uniref:hypothetical protein n=1 Tax=Prevotella sp. TaxID=59823 RepID=UPI0025EA3A91